MADIREQRRDAAVKRPAGTSATTPGLLLSGEQVVVAGDWHGSHTAARDVLRRAHAVGARVVLHVGDLNVPARTAHTSVLTTIDKTARRYDLSVLVSPGNHDNWDRIDSSPLDSEGMHVLGRRTRAVPRGARFASAGRRFGALGGAVSVLGARTPGLSWWAQEIVTDDHVRRLGADPLDVLLTHDAPTGVPLSSGYAPPAHLVAEADEVRARLHAAVQSTRPGLLFCGHWHKRRIHDLPHADGVCTVHVLDREHQPGNAVLLDLSTMTVRPLP